MYTQGVKIYTQKPRTACIAHTPSQILLEYSLWPTHNPPSTHTHTHHTQASSPSTNPLSPSGHPRMSGEGSPVPKSRKSQLCSSLFQACVRASMCVSLFASVCRFGSVCVLVSACLCLCLSQFIWPVWLSFLFPSPSLQKFSSAVKWKPGLYRLINTLCARAACRCG